MRLEVTQRASARPQMPQLRGTAMLLLNCVECRGSVSRFDAQLDHLFAAAGARSIGGHHDDLVGRASKSLL